MTPGVVRDPRVVFNEEILTSASISEGSRGTLTAGTLQAGGFGLFWIVTTCQGTYHIHLVMIQPFLCSPVCIDILWGHRSVFS